MAEAIACMVIHHADGLHEGVTNGGADKAKTARFQILAHRVRFRGACRNFARGRPIIFLGAAAHKLPDVFIERSEFAAANFVQGRFCGLLSGRFRI